MNPTLIERLQNSANKLRHLWGQNDDSTAIEEAIAILSVPAEDTPTETAKSTRRKA
jgi:hypothetical protein